MRVVVDLQGAQTSGSRHRGIGRYSLWLCQALARNRGLHEIVVVLNAAFPDAVDSIRRDLEGLIEPGNIRVWEPVGAVSAANEQNAARRTAAEHVREAFLASLEPDVVLVTSLFEGLGDDAVTSVKQLMPGVPTAVILYDLIPLIHREQYLANETVSRWYEGKLDHLRRADLALAISDSSREEGLRYLGFSPTECVSISTATDPRFRPVRLVPEAAAQLLQAHGITRPFVMYTGGIDHRKNIEGLIRAFSVLPENVRRSHQLAVVCSIQTHDRIRLEELARSSGLDTGDVVFTGFVSDDELLALYNLCQMFVFPSWHEGFGLPALEAMSCGRAVIGANTSSVPEVIGRTDALFDPWSDAAISTSVHRVLTDARFRTELERHGLERARAFTWDGTATKALLAMERLVAGRSKSAAPRRAAATRPRLAFVSPLPPARSGISAYSMELIPELLRHYEIDLIVEDVPILPARISEKCAIRTVGWFVENHQHYDRVLYHFGNSMFHKHMFDLLERVPGVVVLHDFYLSGVLATLELVGNVRGMWTRNLYRSHGYASLAERFHSVGHEGAMYRYPANRCVIEEAKGVIVHSDSSRKMGVGWYGPDAVANWTVVPHLRVPSDRIDKRAARKALGLPAEGFIVCSFGLIGPTKRSAELVDAWTNSSLADREECLLLFVGENERGDYGRRLESTLLEDGRKRRIEITGWVDEATFKTYLAAADVGVQLRTLSRGETSGTVLDCMNFGLATIVNANGSMADLPKSSVLMLPDAFERSQLVHALELLHRDAAMRESLSRAGRTTILTEHSPRRCAERYADAIEVAYAARSIGDARLYRALGDLSDRLSPEELRSTASVIGRASRPRVSTLQLLVDVTAAVSRSQGAFPAVRASDRFVQRWVEHPPPGYRVEPIYWCASSRTFRYARQHTLALLNCPRDALADDVVEFWANDRFVALDADRFASKDYAAAIESMRRAGVFVEFVIDDLSPVSQPECADGADTASFRTFLLCAAAGDTVLCATRRIASTLWDWLQTHGPTRSVPLEIRYLDPAVVVEREPTDTPTTPSAQGILDSIGARPALAVCGPLALDAKHVEVLRVFDTLWKEGRSVNLVVIGDAEYPDSQALFAIRHHPELNRRLFWVGETCPDFTCRVLAKCSAVIDPGISQPSNGGVRQAVDVRTPTLELPYSPAGRSSAYENQVEHLVSSIRGVLDAIERGDPLPQSSTRLVDWATAADRVLNALMMVGGDALTWRHDGVPRFSGDDRRLQTQVGKRRGTRLQTTGQAGFLMFGPYIRLPKGRFEARIRGAAASGRAVVDVAIERSRVIAAANVVAPLPSDTDLARLQFELMAPCDAVEVRIQVDADSVISVERLEIAPISAAPMLFVEGEEPAGDSLPGLMTHEPRSRPGAASAQPAQLMPI